jgi:hypothetical protein
MTMVIADPIPCANCLKPEFWFNGGYRESHSSLNGPRGLKENYVSQSQTPDL